jgi:hypothetical protein
MKNFSTILVFEYAIILLFVGAGSFLERIALNWKNSLILLIIFPFVHLMWKPRHEEIRKWAKENGPPKKIKSSFRWIMATIATILFIIGIINLIFNFVSPKTILYWVILTVCFPLPTVLLFLALYDPINEKISWENLKKRE